jgi:hypothetical protein
MCLVLACMGALHNGWSVEAALALAGGKCSFGSHACYYQDADQTTAILLTKSVPESA